MINLNLPTSNVILEGFPFNISSAQLVAGFTSQFFLGVPVSIKLKFNFINPTWNIDPKSIRYYYDNITFVSNPMGTFTPASQDFQCIFMPGSVFGTFGQTGKSFMEITPNPNLLAVNIDVSYTYWDI